MRNGSPSRRSAGGGAASGGDTFMARGGVPEALRCINEAPLFVFDRSNAFPGDDIVLHPAAPVRGNRRKNEMIRMIARNHKMRQCHQKAMFLQRSGRPGKEEERHIPPTEQRSLFCFAFHPVPVTPQRSPGSILTIFLDPRIFLPNVLLPITLSSDQVNLSVTFQDLIF